MLLWVRQRMLGVSGAKSRVMAAESKEVSECSMRRGGATLEVVS